MIFGRNVAEEICKKLLQSLHRTAKHMYEYYAQ